MMRSWLAGRPPWRGQSSDSSPPVAGGTLLRFADRRNPGRGAPPRRPGRSLASGLLLAALVLPLAGLFAPDAEAQTTGVLVSNMGQTPGTQQFNRQAQPFTTGTDTAVASVEVYLDGNTVGTLVRIAPGASGGGPDLSSSDVITLTSPTTLVADAINTFSAPPNTMLTANTTYYVVTSSSADPTDGRRVGMTTSTSEDSSPASGWSIGNTRYSAAWTSTIWTPNTSTFLRIRINAPGPADTTAPRVTSITRRTQSPTNADTLTWRVTFNEDVKDVGGADFAIAGTTASLSVTAMTGSSSVYDVMASGGDLASLDDTVTLSFASGQDIKDIANNNLTDTAPTGTNDFTFVVDNTAPTVTSIERANPTTSPTNANSLAWQVTFSEALHFTSPGPGTDDFVVSGTTASFFVRRRSSLIEFVVGGSGGDLDDLNGTVTLSFATGQNITDPAGNALDTTGTPSPNDNTFLLDNTAPTVTITAASTSTGPFTATFTFDEAVTGFASGDITVGNGAPSNLQNPTSDNQTFTALITPVATGTVTLNVAADVAMDAVGNGNTAAIQVSISHTASVADTTAPTVTSIVRQDPTTSPTNADTLTWRVTFNENVKDVGDADFAIAGTTASLDVTAMTGSTSVYDVTASGGNLADRNTAVTLSFATGQDIKDIANNNLTDTAPTGTDESAWVVDNTAPTAEKIERHEPTTTPTNADSLTWRITFSEDVQNVSPADFTATGTTAGSSRFRVSNDVYQVEVSGGNLADRNGTVTLGFASNQGITDTAGNDLVTSGTPVPNDNTYEVDNAAPTVTITDVPTDSTGAFPATFTFDEAVSDFVVGDITVGNGTAAAFTGMNGDTEFTAQITPTANGTVTVDVAVDVATDAAGNGNTAATRVSSTYMAPVTDTTAPRVTSIERNTPTTTPTNADTLTWRVTFNEDVKDVGDADFEIAGTTAGLTATAMTGSASVYDVTASGGNLADRNATVTLSFASGQDIKDNADNPLTNTTPTSGTNDNSYLLDNAAPTVTITAASTSTGPFTATFTFDEAVTGFAVGDITVGNGAPSNLLNPTSDNQTFTATITPVSSGDVTLNVAANAAEDAAGNGNTAATQVSSAYMAPGTPPATPSESPLVSLTLGRLLVAEDVGTIVLTVSLNRPAPSALSVLWYTQDDHAEAPNDYTAREGSLTFAAEESQKDISVPIVDDAVREDPVDGVHETFFVILRAGQGYSRSDSSYTLVEIVDNDGDAPPDVTPPQLTQVTANGSTLVLTYNEPLDGTSTPAPGDFAVTVAGGPVGFLRAIRVNAVRVIGATVTLTLAAAVQTGQGVTVDYTPGVNPIQDAAGNDALALASNPVTDTPDPDPEPDPEPEPEPDPANPPPPPPRDEGGGFGGGGETRTPVPGAPSNLTAVGEDGQVVLTWEAPSRDGGAEITDYEYRINGQNPWISIGSTETTYTVTGLDNGAEYTFQVRAVNRIGKSFAPSQVEATPEAPRTVLLAHFANGNNTVFNSRVYLFNPSVKTGRVTVRVFTLPLRGGLAQELTTTPLELGSLGPKSGLNIKLVEDILTPLGITTPYTIDGGNLTLELTILAPAVRGTAQVFTSDFGFGTYPLQEIPSTSAESPTVLVANFTNGNNGALNSRVYLWNPSATDGRVTVRVFTLPNTGDSMRLQTVPLGILKAFSARNIRIAEDILAFPGIALPYTDDGGNLMLEFTIEAPDARGVAQVFSSNMAFGTYVLQEVPSTPNVEPTVLVAHSMNGNSAIFNSRVYLWNPSTSAGEVTVRVFTLPLADGTVQELTGTLPLSLGTLEATSARNIKLAEDILVPLGIPTPYTTDGGKLTLEFRIEAPDVKGVGQVFSSNLAYGTYPLQTVPSVPIPGPTRLVASFTNGNDTVFNSRISLFNPSPSAGGITVRVFTLPLGRGAAQELTTTPLELGILEARSALGIRLAEDILVPLGVSLPYTTDGGNLTLELTIQAADVRGTAQVFSSRLSLGTYPLQ